MDPHRPKPLAQVATLIKTKDGLHAFARSLAASIPAELFDIKDADGNDLPPIIVKVLINGSQQSNKSEIADKVTEHIFPSELDDEPSPLSGYKTELAGEFIMQSGLSFLYGGRSVTLSFIEYDPAEILNRQDLPGIHFDQNEPFVTAGKHGDVWITLDVKAPVPVDPSAAEILEVSKEELEQLGAAQASDSDNIKDRRKWLETSIGSFGYATPEFFATIGDKNLQAAFERSVLSDDPLPRIIVVGVYRPELLNDADFCDFMSSLTHTGHHLNNDTDEEPDDGAKPAPD